MEQSSSYKRVLPVITLGLSLGIGYSFGGSLILKRPCSPEQEADIADVMAWLNHHSDRLQMTLSQWCQEGKGDRRDDCLTSDEWGRWNTLRDLLDDLPHYCAPDELFDFFNPGGVRGVTYRWGSSSYVVLPNSRVEPGCPMAALMLHESAHAMVDADEPFALKLTIAPYLVCFQDGGYGRPASKNP